MNSGQLCVRTDYVLVHNDLADSFLTKLKATVEKMYDNGADKTCLGKVIN